MKMRTLPLSLLVLSCLSLACTPGRRAPGSVEASETDAGAPGVVYEYTIGPSDLLSVTVWKNEDLSREVTVRPDGYISLPLIQDIRAEGMTAGELSRILKQHYKDFIEDPEVSVTVREANSYKIYVLGKVTASGAFVLKSPITVLQAISMAGGFTPFADTSGIVVLRKQNDRDVRIPVNYDDVLRGKNPEENIVLQPGDTVVVP